MEVGLGFVEVSILDMKCWKLARQMTLISGNLAISDDNCIMPYSIMSCESEISKSLRNLTRNGTQVT